MNKGQSGQRFLHILAVAGFDSTTQRRIEECIEGCDGMAAIWCGGTEDELFRFKQWWLNELETVDMGKKLTLFIPPDDDFSYCAEALLSLSERWGLENCKLVICAGQAKGFAAKASQSLRLRILKRKGERQGLTI